MDEQRKHAILFAATLLCARKFLPLMETDHPDPSQEFLTEHFRWRAVEQGEGTMYPASPTHISPAWASIAL